MEVADKKDLKKTFVLPRYHCDPDAIQETDGAVEI